MSLFLPDLDADLVPRVSAAGFGLSESLDTVQEKIGLVDWYPWSKDVAEIRSSSKGWIGVTSVYTDRNQSKKTLRSLEYMNEIVSLFFHENNKLFKIILRNGYRGNFCGINIGDVLPRNFRKYTVVFDDGDEEFFLEENGHDVFGISFRTNYRESFESAPVQVVEYISIHDWSLLDR